MYPYEVMQIDLAKNKKRRNSIKRVVGRNGNLLESNTANRMLDCLFYSQDIWNEKPILNPY